MTLMTMVVLTMVVRPMIGCFWFLLSFAIVWIVEAHPIVERSHSHQLETDSVLFQINSLVIFNEMKAYTTIHIAVVVDQQFEREIRTYWRRTVISTQCVELIILLPLTLRRIVVDCIERTKWASARPPEWKHRIVLSCTYLYESDTSKDWMPNVFGGWSWTLRLPQIELYTSKLHAIAEYRLIYSNHKQLYRTLFIK